MRYPDNTKFLVAKSMKTEDGEFTAGDELPNALKYRNLQTLIDSGFVYPYHPEKGYEYLPQHLFSALRTKKEAKAKIEGDPTSLGSEYEKPAPIEHAEKQAAIQHKAYQLIRDQNDQKLRKAIQKRQANAKRPLDETVRPQLANQKDKPKEEPKAATKEAPKAESKQTKQESKPKVSKTAATKAAAEKKAQESKPDKKSEPAKKTTTKTAAKATKKS